MKLAIALFLVISVSCSAYFFRPFERKINYFQIADNALKKYRPLRKDYVIVIDYSKNIFQKRLLVLDMKNTKVLLYSRVSHAWESGFLYPNRCSNVNGSEKTSKGNYCTEETYTGKYGYSMYVKGLDKGINEQARNRAIVFHSDEKMKSRWSNGCFATPEKINQKIIELTNNGCLVCVVD